MRAIGHGPRNFELSRDEDDTKVGISTLQTPILRQHTAMEWYEQQSVLSHSTTAAQENQRRFSEKTKVYNGTAKNMWLFSTIKRFLENSSNAIDRDVTDLTSDLLKHPCDYHVVKYGHQVAKDDTNLAVSLIFCQVSIETPL
ncbi:uncharacterized protein TNCV_2209901 [Trichonephila clavipes]|nr:uncharacterized protein TNCV_2209901 [Trichonephila clavipes]